MSTAFFEGLCFEGLWAVVRRTAGSGGLFNGSVLDTSDVSLSLCKLNSSLLPLEIGSSREVVA